jgi:hypothetical protein
LACVAVSTWAALACEGGTEASKPEESRCPPPPATAAVSDLQRPVSRVCAPEPLIDSQAQLDALEGCEVFTTPVSIAVECADFRPLYALRVAEQGLAIDGGLYPIASLDALAKLERAQLSLLRVLGSDLHWLSSLRSLDLGAERSVLQSGRLTIRGCPELVSLAGLDQLALAANGLEIEGNLRLETLSPLALPASAGAAHFVENPALRDLGALSAVEQLKSFALRGSAVETLDALGHLIRAGDVQVSSNPMLRDVNGLANLEQSGALMMVDNPALLRTPEFPRLATVQDIQLLNNAKLEAIGAFPILTTLPIRLEVTNAPALTDLAAWPALASVGGLVIARNERLVSLSLPGLSSVRGDLIIASNPLLPSASIAPLRQLGASYEKVAGNQGDETTLADPCPWENDEFCDEAFDRGRAFRGTAREPLCARGTDEVDCDSNIQ